MLLPRQLIALLQVGGHTLTDAVFQLRIQRLVIGNGILIGAQVLFLHLSHGAQGQAVKGLHPFGRLTKGHQLVGISLELLRSLAYHLLAVSLIYETAAGCQLVLSQVL